MNVVIKAKPDRKKSNATPLGKIDIRSFYDR